MDTNTRPVPTAVDWANPLAGLGAATRWNLMAFEWASKGWQQWLQLVTAPLSLPRGVFAPLASGAVEPVLRTEANAQREPRAEAPAARTTQRAGAKPAARRASTRRAATPRSARPQAAGPKRSRVR